MKKATVGLCTVAVLGAFSAIAHGGIVWSDNFDGYATGSSVGGQGGWEGWGGSADAGMALAVSDQFLSAPNSIEINTDPGGSGTGGDDIVRTYADLTSGVYAYEGVIYVPDGHTGSSYFILLNTYVDGSGTSENWSTQVQFGGSDGAPPNTVTADFSGETLDLITGAWVEIRNVINLDVGDDAGDGTPVGRQEFFYGGELLFSGPWRGQVSGAAGSSQAIAATDLFNNFPAGVVYYDDLSISELPPEGACCLSDGDCVVAADETECTDILSGCFQGIGSSCAGSTCYVRTPDGNWILDFSDNQAALEAPGGFTWGVTTCRTNTCDEENLCPISSARDMKWEVTLPKDGQYIISACDADFDSQLAIGTLKCGFDVALEDDTPGCGTASEFRGSILAGTYYVTLEGFSSTACGNFTLNIQLLCPPVELTPGAVPEAEPCGEDLNGGCNMAVPTFEPIVCDETIRGTGFTDTVTRDTDWYELIVLEPIAVNVNLRAQRTGWVAGIVNTEGSGDCADATAIAPAISQADCKDKVTLCAELDPGIWWFFAAPQFTSPVVIDCGDKNEYELTVECKETCETACEPNGGDTDGDGDVDFVDLLNVLANWGPCPGGTPGCVGDTDCNGEVEFVDLLNVLANWTV